MLSQVTLCSNTIIMTVIYLIVNCRCLIILGHYPMLLFSDYTVSGTFCAPACEEKPAVVKDEAPKPQSECRSPEENPTDNDAGLVAGLYIELFHYQIIVCLLNLHNPVGFLCNNLSKAFHVFGVSKF